MNTWFVLVTNVKLLAKCKLW